MIVAMLLHCIYMGGQNGANAIYYPFIESVLKAGPGFFGIAVSVYYGSNLLAGFLLVRFGDVLKRQPMTRFVVSTAVAWLGYSFFRAEPLVLALSVIEGFAVSSLSNLFMTRIQEEAPTEMVGRVWGLVTSVKSVSEVVGILMVGAIAGRFGPAAGYRALGIAIPLLTVVANAWTKSLLRPRTVST